MLALLLIARLLLYEREGEGVKGCSVRVRRGWGEEGYDV